MLKEDCKRPPLGICSAHMMDPRFARQASTDHTTLLRRPRSSRVRIFRFRKAICPDNGFGSVSIGGGRRTKRARMDPLTRPAAGFVGRRVTAQTRGSPPEARPEPDLCAVQMSRRRCPDGSTSWMPPPRQLTRTKKPALDRAALTQLTLPGVPSHQATSAYVRASPSSPRRSTTCPAHDAGQPAAMCSPNSTPGVGLASSAASST